ncbi:cupin domain-containing protein [Paenibacillus xylanexedens]|uniref:cupin domain-containing protein n=1 Tax=Paenibacillus xylanexedens TaxID=528191 RepID=UPI000F52ADEC|nr:cupin domain-containing protein [Paenibacillus xylanexedens]RPK31108.1 Mannose-6-phosphate isomerase [Paenibacillus xylanexedens]
MHYQAIQLNEELSKLNDLWSPKLIGEMNDYQFKIVKIAGDFEWHVHEETDKLFFVLEGEMIIDFRDGQVKISKGEMYIVPKGVEIKPSSEKECHIMLMEPGSEVNTGGTKAE